ncbi:hypothetical protein F2Q70_00017814 [Brassica cretica]|uniref:Uncharacterized protein n=1 Tax=Brassica cretica TaxID=69181 RepID=A0A8S9I4Z3_BRACR|nr:hypothetical protein F2Q70_00017814 [Brassica cretica]
MKLPGQRGRKSNQRISSRGGCNREPQKMSIKHKTGEKNSGGKPAKMMRRKPSLPGGKSREFVGITILFLDEKVNSVIHGFTPVGRTNHYMPSLKACSIVKVDHFEVARLFDNLQVIANTNLELPGLLPHQRNNSSRYPSPH